MILQLMTARREWGEGRGRGTEVLPVCLGGQLGCKTGLGGWGWAAWHRTVAWEVP